MAKTTIAGLFLDPTVITSQTAESSIAGDDVVLLYDTSASAFRKMTRTNFVAGLGGPSQATQSAIKDETNEDTYAPPDLIKHSPGVAKAWGTMTSATVLQTPSYGLSGVADDDTGRTTWSFSVNFSDIDYAPIGSGDSSNNGDINIDTDFPAIGSIQTQARSNINGHAEVDARMSIAVFGDQ